MEFKIDINKIYNSFDMATLFSLCALIFFLPISKASIQIFVSLSILCFFATLITKKLQNFHKTELDIPLFIFFICLCLSVIFAVDFRTSLITLIKKYAEWFLLFFAIVTTLNTKKRIKIFLIILLLSAISVCFDGIYQQITGADLFRGHNYDYKMSASFNHYNNFAGYLGVLLPLTLCLSICGKDKKNRLIFGFITILLGYCLIMTLSKGGCSASLLACILILPFCFLKLKLKKLPRITLEIGILLILATLFIIQVTIPKYWISERIPSVAGWNAGRFGIWHYAFLLFKDRPWLGYGPGSFMTEHIKINPSLLPTYAHNCYLQMLVEIGVIGLASFLLIIAVFLKTTLKHVLKNRDFLLLGVACGLFAYLLHASIDTHFYSMQLSDFFWIMIGLAIAIAKNGPIEI
ncbi:MAG: O-antigen ligase family protein [Candidatus Omnitrophica bacterium]|nr:O-antigen ligase family protein [Candidatus Omnitrophota bacterium]